MGLIHTQRNRKSWEVVCVYYGRCHAKQLSYVRCLSKHLQSYPVCYRNYCSVRLSCLKKKKKRKCPAICLSMLFIVGEGLFVFTAVDFPLIFYCCLVPVKGVCLLSCFFSAPCPPHCAKLRAFFLNVQLSKKCAKTCSCVQHKSQQMDALHS